MAALPKTRTPELPLLTSYPEALRSAAQRTLAKGSLAADLAGRYPDAHSILGDAALYVRAKALKQRYPSNAPPLAKVCVDNQLQIDHRALSNLTAISRVQCKQLNAKREIRIAAVLKGAPAAMRQMIVVHKLAHLLKREHNKGFHALRERVLPGYLRIEFDLRLYLSVRAAQQIRPAQSQTGPAPGLCCFQAGTTAGTGHTLLRLLLLVSEFTGDPAVFPVTPSAQPCA